MVQCFRYSVAQEAPVRAEERSADSNELPAVTVSGRLHSSKDPPNNSLFAVSNHLASKISKIGQHGVPIIRPKGGHDRQNRLMVACPQTGNKFADRLGRRAKTPSSEKILGTINN